MKRRSFLHLAAGAPLLAQKSKQPAKTEWIAWIGTYTGPKSKGIYAYRWLPGERKFPSLGLSVETPNPSFLAAHPNQQFLYAVNELNTLPGMTPTSAFPKLWEAVGVPWPQAIERLLQIALARHRAERVHTH